jgi:Holliday junction resolvase RusA-like endonuclease
VSRWGVYYPASYKNFRKVLKQALEDQLDERGCARVCWPCDVGIVITCPKPKTTKLPFPKGDVDNFAKGVLDSANKVLIDDDWMVRCLIVMKQWGPKGVIDIFIKDDSVAKRNPRLLCRRLLSRL